MLSAYRFDVWFAIYICAVALTQLLGAKTMPIVFKSLEIQASASLFLVPFSLTMVDAVLEVRGRERANGLVCAGLFTIVFVACVSALMVSMPASKGFVRDQEAYVLAFGGSLRFALTSIVSFFGLQLVNLLVFDALRLRSQRSLFWRRSFIGMASALLIDTVVFTIVDHVDAAKSLSSNLSRVIFTVVAYGSIRICVAALGIPFAYLGSRWLRVSK